VAGKTIPDPGFAGDRGEPSPVLAAALVAWSALVTRPDSAPVDLRTASYAVAAAAASARLLIPVVAQLVELEPESSAGSGLAREKSTEMALVTIMGSDGRRALPAFTGLDALARWPVAARPVPVSARNAAIGALSEGADLVVLDPAGPIPFELDGARLRAIAAGRPVVEPADDAEVRAAVLAAAGGEPLLDSARLGGSGPDQDLTLALVPAGAAGPDELRALANRVAGRLAADELLRARLDRGVAIAVLPARVDG